MKDDVRFAIDFVEKGGGNPMYWRKLRSGLALGPSLCGHGDLHRDQLGHLTKVQSGGCEGELVTRAVRAPQSQAIELKNALEVREQHFDLLAEPTRSAALPRSCDLARHVASALVDRARHPP